MSNGQFSRNLNMEIVGPLLAQIGKSILIISSPHRAACSAPNLFITGEYK
jgi:hypothetical protein